MVDLPDVMRAVLLTGHGGIDKLEYREDWPLPVPGRDEVLIKVHACGLNNTDVNTRVGWYSSAVTEGTTGAANPRVDEDEASWGGAPIEFPRIQGADACGTVVAVGQDTDTSLIGKRALVDVWQRDWNDPMNMDKCGYFGSEIDGGFADYAKVDHRNLHPIDSDLSHAELATFATSYVTAENMLARAQVGPNDRVLITGASGGVGSALIQLAHRRGAKTIALCGDSKKDAIAALGCEAVLPREPEDLKAAISGATCERHVSVIADVVGGDSWPRLIDCLERGGRYTCSGAVAGPIVRFDLRVFYLHDLVFTGATVVPPARFEDLVGYIERGDIKPLLAETYLLKDLVKAQQSFMAKKHVGNIVVTMD